MWVAGLTYEISLALGIHKCRSALHTALRTVANGNSQFLRSFRSNHRTTRSARCFRSRFDAASRKVHPAVPATALATSVSTCRLVRVATRISAHLSGYRSVKVTSGVQGVAYQPWGWYLMTDSFSLDNLFIADHSLTVSFIEPPPSNRSWHLRGSQLPIAYAPQKKNLECLDRKARVSSLENGLAFCFHL